ncbi:timeless protein-domain-containing protein, partial [Vararia minispora EC-137]
DDVISIHSEDEGYEHRYNDRRAILGPAIQNVVDALGGYEGGVYRMGDEAYGCLKDLKKYWRKDDTDDDRTVARIFWESRVLPNDLVPILLETAGKGHLDDKRAIACIDLVTAMTWPIDLAVELKELDDEADRGADYTKLLQSHLYYKAALLRPHVLESLFNVMLYHLSKGAHSRTERDIQIMNVILHLIRNLAFIRDPPSNIHLSSDRADLANMQNDLIRILHETQFLELILTIASNSATDATFNAWNVLVLDILYLLFRGVRPESLVLEQALQSQRNLRQLLSIEDKRRRDFNRNAPSRHSRFGTTITVTINPKKQLPPPAPEGDEAAPTNSSVPSSRGLVVHKQGAISKEAGVLIDLTKKQRKHKIQKADELSREQNLSLDARERLQAFARGFIESCFNPFLASLLKDIRSERPKIAEKDHVRLLFVAKWFLEFFLALRTKQTQVGIENLWDFGLVSTVVERSWIIWVLKRMNGAQEEKPKAWTELQAAIECLTQLLALIDALASTPTDAAAPTGATDLADAAELLQSQLIYNGQILDAAVDGLLAYRPGTQALAFLDAAVRLAYALMRMLERWSKSRGDGTYVRKRHARRRKRATAGEDGVPDHEEEEYEREREAGVEESIFSFEAYEMKFAHPSVTASLLAYLSRYTEFTTPEPMKRIVSLLHRQAVRAKAEGLFFQVSTLTLFKAILADRASLPREQAYADLVHLIKYILRQFFKAVEEDSMVLVEAFFPTNRGRWKRLSSWEPPRALERDVEDTRFPPDVQVKKGHSWSEEVGIAMAALAGAGKADLIEWTKDILEFVVRQRKRIIEETDGPKKLLTAEDAEGDEDEELRRRVLTDGPSAEAQAQINDYLIPYVSDEQALAATREPYLKLLFRLMHFAIQDENSDELDWYIPAGLSVETLQQSLRVIQQYQAEPFNLNGAPVSSLLSKKPRRRVRRRLPSHSSSGNDDDSDAEMRTRRKARSKKEEKQYKSAQFVEDSDAEFEDDKDAFFAREAALRVRTDALAKESASGSGTMRKTGTKKRVRGDEGGRGRKRLRAGGGLLDSDSEAEAGAAPETDEDSDAEADAADEPRAGAGVVPAAVGPARPRP